MEDTKLIQPQILPTNINVNAKKLEDLNFDSWSERVKISLQVCTSNPSRFPTTAALIDLLYDVTIFKSLFPQHHIPIGENCFNLQNLFPLLTVPCCFHQMWCIGEEVNEPMRCEQVDGAVHISVSESPSRGFCMQKQNLMLLQ